MAIELTYVAYADECKSLFRSIDNMPTATCLCGTCRIDVSSSLANVLCHCTTCRKMSSSAYTINAAVPKEAFRLVSGSPKSYEHTNASSGITSTLHFCDRCGSALWIDYPPVPHLRVIKGGILDDGTLHSAVMQPQSEQWTSSRLPWQCAIERANQFELAREARIAL